jgi:hypothetical protein
MLGDKTLRTVRPQQARPARCMACHLENLSGRLRSIRVDPMATYDFRDAVQELGIEELRR